VAHLHHRIVSELQPQLAGDLLRRPPLAQPADVEQKPSGNCPKRRLSVLAVLACG